MEPTPRVDTSLDLNFHLFCRDDKPLVRAPDHQMKRTVENFPAFLERKFPVKQEAGVLAEELSRMKAENKKLTEMLTAVCENYSKLESQFKQLRNNNNSLENEPETSRKRKADCDDYTNVIGFSGNTESSSSDEESSKRPKEISKVKTSRVYVRTNPSDTSLIVKDGYQWRKYGQKVTRDNPSPRAYFKCSFAPSCPVKKKVQKSAEDPSILVATYDGEHNHAQVSPAEALSVNPSPAPSAARSLPLSASPKPSTPTVTLDLIQPEISEEDKKSIQHIDSPRIQQILVQQMAASLTRDPNFTAALAAAISGRFLDQSR